MKEIIEFLKENKFGNLATCSNEKPDLRPFELVFYCDRGMFFYVSADTDAASELKANPNICFCATDNNYNYVKVSGRVLFSDNIADKSKILEESKFAKKFFDESNLQKMLVFYLPHGKCKHHFYKDNKIITEEF